jgi:hypothetical protein
VSADIDGALLKKIIGIIDAAAPAKRFNADRLWAFWSRLGLVYSLLPRHLPDVCVAPQTRPSKHTLSRDKRRHLYYRHRAHAK